MVEFSTVYYIEELPLANHYVRVVRLEGGKHRAEIRDIDDNLVLLTPLTELEQAVSIARNLVQALSMFDYRRVSTSH